MLSDIEKVKAGSEGDMRGVITLRIRFQKTGSLQYISHLDLQRTFNRAMVRAGLPLWYTKGFNPHAKVVYALPLPVGVESVCELADVRLYAGMPEEEILKRLKCEFTDELSVSEVYVPNTKFSEIAWAEYEFELNSPSLGSVDAERAAELFRSSPIMVMKRSKSGESETDISKLVGSFEAGFDGKLRIKAALASGSEGYLNPEYIVTALRSRLGILCGGDVNESCSIVRTHIKKADLTDFR